MNDIEAQLRATLTEQAGRAPNGDALAERILAELDAPTPVLRPRHGWRTWTMPLLAAAAVAAVVATVVGISQFRSDSAPRPPLQSHVVVPPSSSSATSPTTAPTTRPTPTSQPRRSGTSTQRSSGTGPAVLHHFQAIDATFYGTEDGWALGYSDCLTGSGTCPAMQHTTDGGRIWTSMTQPYGANVPVADGCASPCIEQVRFATPTTGYAFGPSALYMTTDAGASWHKQTGNAIALETLDNNVIRVVESGSGCPGPCDVHVETAGVGSSDWTTTRLAAGTISPDSVQLVRSGSSAYVLAMQNPAGGASGQQSTLYASTDDGAHWQARGEPCPQSGATEVDSVAIAAGRSGSTVTALCVPRDGTSPAFAVVSHDSGANATRTAGTVPRVAAGLLAGDPGTVLVAAGSDGAYRSTDGGASWQPLPGVTGSDATFLGFESDTVGRYIDNGGRTIWTTTNRGASWSRFDFPS